MPPWFTAIVVPCQVPVVIVPVVTSEVLPAVGPTPILVLKVAPLSATGSPLPSPTIISPSDKTPIAVIAPVPLPNKTPPSVNVSTPVPPRGTVSTSSASLKLLAAKFNVIPDAVILSPAIIPTRSARASFLWAPVAPPSKNNI